MQQSIPLESRPEISPAAAIRLAQPSTTGMEAAAALAGGEERTERRRVEILVSENAVIVFCRRGCCMGHVVRRLLLALGANPAVCEVGEEEEMGGGVQFPAVFIGGSFFGGLDRVMATHISGELVPILKSAGALWL